MEFICPVCKKAGDISQGDLKHPLTKTRCGHCDAILLVNPDSGKVDAHKSAIKDPHRIEGAGSNDSAELPGVLSMSQGHKSDRDWPAVAVLGVLLLISLAAVVYAIVHSGDIMAPIHHLSEFFKNFL